MYKTLANARVVFDVGANKGEWVQTALKINPNLHIAAFEPVHKTFTLLSKNKFPKNVHLENCGLGSKKGLMTIHVNPESLVLSSLYNRSALQDSAQAKAERIKINTLDAYCASQGITAIDYLKVDVEGAELDVLKGAKNMLSKGGIKHIQFEYGATFIEPRILLKDIFALLTENKYSIYKILPDRLQPVTYSYSLENFQYANYFAQRGD